jgi:hypothetical protein
MFGLWLALLAAGSVGEWFLYAGLVLAWVATAMYIRDGVAQMSGSSSA